MNDTEQIKAIAEACGYINVGTGYRWEGKVTRHWNSSEVYGDWPQTMAENVRVPDYLNDLNAMREPLKLLETLTWRSIGKADFVHPDVVDLPLYPAYLSHLCSVCRVTHYMRGGEADTWAIVCATPAQQAEAFLRTIGKWEK